MPALAWYVNELIDLFGFSPFFSLIFNEDIELRGSSRQEIALYFHNGKEAKIQAQCLDSAVSGKGSRTAYILLREKAFHHHRNRKLSLKPRVGYPLIHFSHPAIEAIPLTRKVFLLEKLPKLLKGNLLWLVMII